MREDEEGEGRGGEVGRRGEEDIIHSTKMENMHACL